MNEKIDALLAKMYAEEDRLITLQNSKTTIDVSHTVNFSLSVVRVFIEDANEIKRLA